MNDFEDQYQREDVTMNMERKKMRTALTIAGSDSSGGAGIQADIKTMTVNGVYAMSAVTALTAQNTVGVKAIMEASPEFLEEQLDCIFTDIRPDAVKIGMLSSAALMRTVARKLKEYQAENIVVDPVMVSTSGSRLMAEEAVQVMKEEICPLADVITPNLPEAEVLVGRTIVTEQEMEEAAAEISRVCRTAVLLKGGSAGNGSTIQIPTEPAVPCPAPSPRILPRDFPWKNRWNGRKNTCPALWRICWIWAMAAAR